MMQYFERTQHLWHLLAMNRLATKPQNKSPRIVAKLDLTDEGHRRLHDLIARMHGGRRPTLRAIAIRQIGDLLHEAVEWLNAATPSFAVVTWQTDGHGLSWRKVKSEAAARALLKAIR